MRLKIIKLLFLLKKFNVRKCPVIHGRIILVILLFFPIITFSQVIRKSGVSFSSEDGLLITADNYFSKRDNPYIILLHTEGSSRGEYDSIASRFLKMNYNCLSVDLRSGYRYDFTINETAMRAKEKGMNTALFESINDIKASIGYLKEISGEPVILMGSSYSATLALLIGKDNPDVKAVIAFSPGEFFLPEITLTNVLDGYYKPVFAGFSAAEYSFFTGTPELTDNENITLFKPSHGPGKRTVEALLDASENSVEYWFALLVFFRSLR